MHNLGLKKTRRATRMGPRGRVHKLETMRHQSILDLGVQVLAKASSLGSARSGPRARNHELIETEANNRFRVWYSAYPARTIVRKPHTGKHTKSTTYLKMLQLVISQARLKTTSYPNNQNITFRIIAHLDINRNHLFCVAGAVSVEYISLYLD